MATSVTNKVAVVTSIFGGFDAPKPMPAQSMAFDYFCFTEKSGFPFRDSLDNRLKAKYFKYQQHNVRQLQHYDYYIWIDGSIDVQSPYFVEYMVRQLHNSDFAITEHNKRDCIYQEMDYIIGDQSPYIMSRYGHEKHLMAKQKEDYQLAGMPEHWGLFCCGLFSCRNNPEVNKFMDYVWIDTIRYASQDQNPFPFYAWKFGLKLNRLTLDICRNHFWHLKHHA